MDEELMLGDFTDGKYVRTKKSVPAGRFWCQRRQFTVQGQFKPLLASTLGSRVRDFAKDAGLGDATTTETPGASETREKLAGHFLRGHAGSIAYVLATQRGASWEADEGINRARHTMNSFFKNYLRGVSMRLLAAFDAIPQQLKELLRFEEAARL